MTDPDDRAPQARRPSPTDVTGPATVPTPGTGSLGRRRGLGRLGAVLAAAIVALAVAGCGAAHPSSASTSAPSAKQAGASETKAPASGPATSRTPRARHTSTSSQAEADGWTTFASPTGNITCAMNAHGAGCDVADKSWSLTSADLASCGQLALAGLSLPAHGAAGFDCRSDVAVPDPQRVLAYGKSLTTGPISCSSAATGMTCRDRRTGHGFFVSRATFRRY